MAVDRAPFHVAARKTAGAAGLLILICIAVSALAGVGALLGDDFWTGFFWIWLSIAGFVGAVLGLWAFATAWKWCTDALFDEDSSVDAKGSRDDG
ncbi:hypothetical protein ABE583_07975 [Stenotrophomonas sp. TWI143]|uniref:hypothetical protein n=1 Tax=Stenotrophomonas sp. TWI143 TaxID=3136771 RepID=UPI0032088A82